MRLATVPNLCRLVIFAGLSTIAAALPQGRWKQIGSTSTGNLVFIDPATVKKDKAGIITATFRVPYAKPVATPKGPITATRAIAMFNCIAHTVAIKESTIYHDGKSGGVFQVSKPGKPGFGPPFASTFSGVALDYLCSSAKAR